MPRLPANLFNNVFAITLKTFGITANDISEYHPNQVDSNTVTSWRTRYLPDVGPILEAVQGVLSLGVSQDYNQSKLPEYKESVRKNVFNIPVSDFIADEIKFINSQDCFESISYALIGAYGYCQRQRAQAAERENSPVRLVAFDLAGTLIKGIQYGRKILWDAIGAEDKEAAKVKRDFELGRISYEEWCNADCEKLRAGGLTKEKVHDAIVRAGCSLTRNMREAIKKLKKHNCKVAVISGGVDTILYDVIEDADQLFDAIFINKLIYDERTGVLEKIIPTKYDWDSYGIGVEGKQAGFIRLCERFGADPMNSVFVGDGVNDFGAMESVGMKILYFAGSTFSCGRSNRPGIRGIPSDAITELCDDLMRVADRIIAWNFSDGVSEA